MQPNAVEIIQTELRAAGWRSNGRTKPEVHVFGRKTVMFVGRQRYAKGNRRCTVGSRVICFYRRTKRGIEGHITVRTRDLEGIRSQI